MARTAGASIRVATPRVSWRALPVTEPPVGDEGLSDLQGAAERLYATPTEVRDRALGLRFRVVIAPRGLLVMDERRSRLILGHELLDGWNRRLGRAPSQRAARDQLTQHVDAIVADMRVRMGLDPATAPRRGLLGRLRPARREEPRDHPVLASRLPSAQDATPRASPLYAEPLTGRPGTSVVPQPGKPATERAPEGAFDPLATATTEPVDAAGTAARHEVAAGVDRAVPDVSQPAEATRAHAHVPEASSHLAPASPVPPERSVRSPRVRVPMPDVVWDGLIEHGAREGTERPASPRPMTSPLARQSRMTQQSSRRTGSSTASDPTRAAEAEPRSRAHPRPTQRPTLSLRRELAGTVDPLTGEILGPGDVVVLCARCEAAYRRESHEFLASHENRCVRCDYSFRSRRPIEITVPGGRSRRLSEGGTMAAPRTISATPPTGSLSSSLEDSAPAGGSRRQTFRLTTLGAVDPLTGVEHEPQATVHVCAQCGVAYSSASMQYLASRRSGCVRCGVSFAARPARLQAAGVGNHSHDAATDVSSGREAAPAYRVGGRVRHNRYGIGQVVGVRMRGNRWLVECDFPSRPERRITNILADSEAMIPL